jgi:hypothetical protein
MNQLFKTVSIAALLCWSISTSQACFQEQEEIKGQSSKPLSSLKETEKEMESLSFNHYFEEGNFLKSSHIKLNGKSYIWNIHDKNCNLLIEKPILHNKVLLALNNFQREMNEWKTEDKSKVIGLSLGICGEDISIEAFLGRNAR